MHCSWVPQLQCDVWEWLTWVSAESQLFSVTNVKTKAPSITASFLLDPTAIRAKARVQLWVSASPGPQHPLSCRL